MCIYRSIYFQESYIIDNGSNGVWAWIGKNSSKKERSEAMRNALVRLYWESYITDNDSKCVVWLEKSDINCRDQFIQYFTIKASAGDICDPRVLLIDDGKCLLTFSG